MKPWKPRKPYRDFPMVQVKKGFSHYCEICSKNINEGTLRFLSASNNRGVHVECGLKKDLEREGKQ